MTALERHLVLLKRSFFSLDRCSADTGPFFFRTSMRTADTCKSTARAEDKRLCSRCGLGRFTYRRKTAVRLCPVIRWQGERGKRQGLWRALAGGLCGCCGRMLRRQLSRQQKAAVTPPGRGCAPWPVLWLELLLGVYLDALRAGKNNFPPLLSLKGGKAVFDRNGNS